MNKLTCHCGKIEAEVKVPEGGFEKIMRCNCSICKRKGNMTMQFYLPLKFDKNNVPIPSRPDVEIVNIEGGYFAVIVYSGRSSDKNFTKHKDILENELKKDDISILGPPIKATYNSPFTLPIMRRNEAMFRVKY